MHSSPSQKRGQLLTSHRFGVSVTRCAPLCVLPLSSIIIIAVLTETHPGSTSRLPEVAQIPTDVSAHPVKGALSSGTRWTDRADDHEIPVGLCAYPTEKGSSVPDEKILTAFRMRIGTPDKQPLLVSRNERLPQEQTNSTSKGYIDDCHPLRTSDPQRASDFSIDAIPVLERGPKELQSRESDSDPCVWVSKTRETHSWDHPRRRKHIAGSQLQHIETAMDSPTCMPFIYFPLVLLHLRFGKINVNLLHQDATFVAAVE